MDTNNLLVSVFKMYNNNNIGNIHFDFKLRYTLVTQFGQIGPGHQSDPCKQTKKLEQRTLTVERKLTVELRQFAVDGQ